MHRHHPTGSVKSPKPQTRTRQPTLQAPPLVVFKRSPIHGIGGFATAAVPKGAHVIEYLGEKIDKRESVRRCEKNNQYIFALNEKEDLDGSVEWNPARHLNHSCAPNCAAQAEAGRVWIVANRDIQAGEELTFNYGYDLADYKEFPCSCGAPNCVGYIVAEEFFDHVLAARELSSLKPQTPAPADAPALPFQSRVQENAESLPALVRRNLASSDSRTFPQTDPPSPAPCRGRT